MTQLVNIGDVLAGKYRVEKILGIGGMGMVVAARHLELDQRVALKFMLPKAATSEQAIDRFLREARAAVRLRNEHVCRVLDVGRLEYGAPYIVMEYLEGYDFQHVIKRRGPLAPAEATACVLQAMEGLAEAHAVGIVHRDLKPCNLFVTTDSGGAPLVKVLDFGISKSSAGGGTRTGDVMGSPAYMAPEQMQSSKDVDPRADVWALGVILYEAVTGELPFEAETLPAVCMAVMNSQPVAPAQRRPGVSPEFSAVVMRCLAKSPAARYADVGELAAALVPFGPPDAEAAAARIAQIGRRAAARASTASEAAATAPPLAGLLAPTPDGLARPSPLPVGGGTLGRNSTLRSSLGEQMRRLRGAARRPWIIVGLVCLGAITAGVVAALGQHSPAAEAVHEAAAAPAPPAAVAPAPAVVAPAPAPAPAPAAPAPAAPAPAAPAPAAPPPLDPAASLHAAQAAYAGGEYDHAIVLAKSALHVQPAGAWRIIGAASCMRHDAATARAAIGHADASGRAFVRHACQKAGVALETPHPAAAPDDPWTHLQHDQDTP